MYEMLNPVKMQAKENTPPHPVNVEKELRKNGGDEQGDEDIPLGAQKIEENTNVLPVQSKKRKRLSEAQKQRKRLKSKRRKKNRATQKSRKRRARFDLAVMNAGACLGVDIDKTVLDEQLPTREEKNTNLAEVMSTPVVQSTLSFEYENYEHQKGGRTFALSQVKDGGVRLIIADVFGKETECHAFIYDSGSFDPLVPTGQGAFIDPTQKVRRVLKPCDRETKEAARNALNGFFGGARVNIRVVYRVRVKLTGEV
jgi:hypothetical protein